MGRNFRTVKFLKGAKGYLSTVGMYGYWYPSQEYETNIIDDVEAEHLACWRNQNPYFAFKVPAHSVRTITENLSADQYVCVWFTEKEILKNKMRLNQDKE